MMRHAAARAGKSRKTLWSIAWRRVVAIFVIAAAASLSSSHVIAAQQTAPPPGAPQPVTLAQAVDLALKNYPAIRAAEGQTTAARAGVDLARTAYLPRTDLLFQENRATRNNVAGLLLPQSVIPSITGPVSTAAYNGVWDSAAGALVSWEPFDFGQRHANVAVAQDVVAEATAGADVTRLQVGVAAADAFLTAAAAEQQVNVAQASVDRLTTLQTSVTTLVQNQLRPGADASRADAELASAKIQLILAQRNATNARIALAVSIGAAGTDVSPDAGALLDRTPPSSNAASPALDTHPAARAQQAIVDATHARAEALAQAYVPHINVQSALFARGAAPSTAPFASSDGLVPNTASNWAFGVTVGFPVFDIFGVRAHRQIEFGHEAVERARYDQQMQTLRASDAQARSDFDTARAIADNTPVGLRAARDAESQVRARYEAGLATMTEVADVQRLLTQSEIDDRLAHLGVWRALLAEAAAHGDLTAFLAQAK